MLRGERLQKRSGNRVSKTRVSIREKATKGIRVWNRRVGAFLVGIIWVSLLAPIVPRPERHTRLPEICAAAWNAKRLRFQRLSGATSTSDAVGARPTSAN